MIDRRTGAPAAMLVLAADIVDKVDAAVRRLLPDAAAGMRIEESGSLGIGNSPREVAKQDAAEFALFREVVAKHTLTLQ